MRFTLHTAGDFVVLFESGVARCYTASHNLTPNSFPRGCSRMSRFHECIKTIGRTGMFFILAVCYSTLSPSAVGGELTGEEKDAGFVLMFNGADFNGWRFTGEESDKPPVRPGADVPSRDRRDTRVAVVNVAVRHISRRNAATD